MLLGVGVGSAVGLAMLLNVSLSNLPWIVAVGLAKLTLLASGGLLASGAVLQRLATRRDTEARLAPPSDGPPRQT
jgi:hypothetical protein